MKDRGKFTRRTFLKDHQPVSQRMLLHSTGTEFDMVAGTVIGELSEKRGEFKTGAAAVGVLVEDITVPAAGDVYALVYVHAEVIGGELIWGAGVSAKEQQTAREVLRTKGVFVSEA